MTNPLAIRLGGRRRPAPRHSPGAANRGSARHRNARPVPPARSSRRSARGCGVHHNRQRAVRTRHGLQRHGSAMHATAAVARFQQIRRATSSRLSLTLFLLCLRRKAPQRKSHSAALRAADQKSAHVPHCCIHTTRAQGFLHTTGDGVERSRSWPSNFRSEMGKHGAFQISPSRPAISPLQTPL